MWEKRTDGGGRPRNTCRAHGLLLSDAGQLAVLVGPLLLEPGKREHSSFLKLAPYATVTWHIKFCFRSMGFRTHYPQIMAPLDMVNILSRGDLRRGRYKEGALSPPKQDARPPRETRPRCAQRDGVSFSRKRRARRGNPIGRAWPRFPGRQAEVRPVRAHARPCLPALHEPATKSLKPNDPFFRTLVPHEGFQVTSNVREICSYACLP